MRDGLLGFGQPVGNHPAHPVQRYGFIAAALIKCFHAGGICGAGQCGCGEGSAGEGRCGGRGGCGGGRGATHIGFDNSPFGPGSADLRQIQPLIGSNAPRQGGGENACAVIGAHGGRRGTVWRAWGWRMCWALLCGHRSSGCGALSWRRGGCIRRITLFEQNGDGRIDLHIRSAFGHQEFADDALINGFKLHCRFVGFNLSQKIARLNPISFSNQPFGQGSLFHRGR